MVGNDFHFLQDLYDNGARGFFDAVGVHTDTPCLIAPPDCRLPRDGRPHRALRVHRLPRGAPRDGPQRRRRQADLDDRDRLEHVVDGAELLPRRRRRGRQARRRDAGPAGGEPRATPTRAWPPTRSSTVALWFSLQDTPGRPSYDGHLGLLRADGSAKPAYAAMKALRNGTRATADTSRVAACSTTPPRICASLRPSDGLRFSDRLSLRAVAADALGGTGVSHVELLADGKRVVKVAGRVAEARSLVRRPRHGSASVRTRSRSWPATAPATPPGARCASRRSSRPSSHSCRPG